MKKLLLPVLLLLSCTAMPDQATGQELEGSVSYITSQNVYVKFATTAAIAAGDTLYLRQGDAWIPALRVSNLSSMSCVCTPVGQVKISLSDRVVHRPHVVETPKPAIPQQPAPVPQPDPVRDTLPETSSAGTKPVQDISGFASVASFLNFSNTTAANSLKMKYTLSFNIRNIGKSHLSAESYLTFFHTDRNWNEIQANVFNGLKIYNLSLNYQFNRHFNLLIGRKINPRIYNVGAVDGLQFEMTFRPISIGIIAGSRPNYPDYGVNFSLIQIGAYVAQENTTRNGYIQTTLGYIQQTNAGKTDRQVIYLQHANSVIRNLSFFGSVEVDLYNKVLNPEDSTLMRDNSPKISNLYLSLSYRLKRKLNLSVSYSALQNVIYYETYKSFLDELLNSAVLQGYQFQAAYHPITRIVIGASAGYRFQKEDPRPTKNIYSYFTYSQIPAINISSTVSFTWLETAYTSGKIYGIGISKDFFAGKLTAGLKYFYVDYKFFNDIPNLPQHVAEANLTWRIIRRLAFSAYYEGTFESNDQFNRIYLQLNLGF